MKPYIRDERELRDGQAQSYDRWIPEYQHLVEWQSVWKRLSLRFRPGCAVLDSGCGTGRFTERLIVNGARPVGIDLSYRSLEVLRSRAAVGVPWVAQADVRSLPFCDAAFDQALCSEVLEHLIDPEDAVALLRELRRTLRPGGQLVLTTYNYWLGARLLRDKALLDTSRSRYRRRTRREFRELLLEVFSPSEIIGVWGILNFVGRPFPGWRILPKRMWPALARIDLMLEGSSAASCLGRLLLAEVRKRDRV
jgi:SAM-dependent methyltransferase